MKVPHRDRAWVPVEKIEHYLLAEAHLDGANKAHFLGQMGFELRDADMVVDQLLSVIERENVVTSVTTVFGRKYVVDGIIEGPVGRNALFRTVWIVPINDERPRFVTAYPLSGASI